MIIVINIITNSAAATSTTSTRLGNSITCQYEYDSMRVSLSASQLLTILLSAFNFKIIKIICIIQIYKYNKYNSPRTIQDLKIGHNQLQCNISESAMRVKTGLGFCSVNTA